MHVEQLTIHACIKDKERKGTRQENEKEPGRRTKRDLAGERKGTWLAGIWERIAKTSAFPAEPKMGQ